ncbi:hypothetical protein [Chengkuizengella axinellae]|uniref:CUB domain-containing protein n=1 Tax=Chengkuizengella axinellae TaxID=3064388 RepID=A0ABT9J0V7_9BACL|nr:hypothetical protein [Chengkuizengella sp. 2205SS18-9]MDP5275261.1 hypothetical protein [Chengkuizengella sp. 2205SS18-9]
MNCEHNIKVRILFLEEVYKISDYQIGIDIIDLRNRIEKLESCIPIEDGPEIITTVDLMSPKIGKHTTTGFINKVESKIPYIYGENDYCTWAYVYVGSGNNSVFFKATLNVEGDGPIAGSFTEWNPSLGSPHFGDVNCYTYMEQRRPGQVRIGGRHDWDKNLPCAVGYIAYKK